MYFLDDVLKAGDQGLRGRPVVVSPSEARDAGIALSPEEALLHKSPRRYGTQRARLVHEPSPPENLTQPETEDGPALVGTSASETQPTRPPSWQSWARRTLILRSACRCFDQLAIQHDANDKSLDVPVDLSSTVPGRGYLMFGAYSLSQAKRRLSWNQIVYTSSPDVEAERWQTAALSPRPLLRTKDLSTSPGAPAGWTEATRDAAESMRATFGVAKATKNGALHSNHIRGFAADITANALPRFRPEYPDGAKVTFDLSGDDESRDLSLTPKVITWINQHMASRS